MPNMSYCRFRNTLIDLSDVSDALIEKGMPNKETDPEEYAAAVELIKLCEDIAAEAEIHLEED